MFLFLFLFLFASSLYFIRVVVVSQDVGIAVFAVVAFVAFVAFVAVFAFVAVVAVVIFVTVVVDVRCARAFKVNVLTKKLLLRFFLHCVIT